MNQPVPGRRWEFLDWGDEWVAVLQMSAWALVLANGFGVVWRAAEYGGSSWMPDVRLRLRYTVPFGDGEMPWRETDWRDLPLLAQDMGHGEWMAPMRDAMSEARREKNDLLTRCEVCQSS